MRAVYGERWNKKLGEPMNPMSEDEARARDAAGEQYCVVLGPVSAPDAVLEISWEQSYLGVLFIDDAGRVHTQYDFNRVDDRRLFLSEVTTWSYPEGARSMAQADVVNTTVLRPDGYVQNKVDDESSDQIEVTEYRDVPVDANWEDVPRFGDWESVARYDRG